MLVGCAWFGCASVVTPGDGAVVFDTPGPPTDGPAPVDALDVPTPPVDVRDVPVPPVDIVDVPIPPVDIVDVPPIDVPFDLPFDLRFDIPVDIPVDVPTPVDARDIVDVPLPCMPGFARCGALCRDLSTDPASCGACDRVCPSGPNAFPVCRGGSCGIVCDRSYGDCNGNPSDGCETNTQTNPDACGSCGVVCLSRPNSTRTCVFGMCQSACLPGFADCNGIPADGCETDLNVTATSCGRCGNLCAVGQLCMGGACRSGAGYRSYIAARSTEGFIDACGLPHNTYLPRTDDNTATETLPFAFQFYATNTRNIWLSSNVVVGFRMPSAAYTNSCLPFGPMMGALDTAILGYWDDLMTREGVCTATLGVAPTRRWVATWRDMHMCCTDDPSVHMNISIVLNETGHNVDVVFGPMIGGGSDGSGATVGVVNETGTVASQFSCNAPGSIRSGTAIRFIPVF